MGLLFYVVVFEIILRAERRLMSLKGWEFTCPPGQHRTRLLGHRFPIQICHPTIFPPFPIPGRGKNALGGPLPMRGSSSRPPETSNRPDTNPRCRTTTGTNRENPLRRRAIRQNTTAITRRNTPQHSRTIGAFRRGRHHQSSRWESVTGLARSFCHPPLNCRATPRGGRPLMCHPLETPHPSPRWRETCTTPASDQIRPPGNHRIRR